jgi:DNA-directed RNA polymerase subunit RPC12/RpoP
MPIRFRCSHCNRLLGIARRKAGSETRCPHCGGTIMVPADGEGDDERTRLDDIDELINPVSVVQAPAIATRPAPPSVPRAVPRPAPEPLPLDEPPLFERDLDSVLEAHNAGSASGAAKPKPATAVGMDAMSLEPERNHLVISSQKATALVVIVVVLLALSFAAGFLIASR